MASACSDSDIFALWAAHQPHTVQFLDNLTSEEKAAFAEQLRKLPPPQQLISAAQRALSQSQQAASIAPADVGPVPPPVAASAADFTKTERAELYAEGLRLIATNTVGVILMAGGQGTRLGSSAPKGCYDVGLPSHKSLFQIQAERIARLQKLTGGRITWYVMTSGPTRRSTETFFIEHKYFGLNPDDVFFFEQGVMPCFSSDGSSVLLSGRSEVAVAPDGNGGLYAALANSGALADMEKRGIRHLHAYCVDNCLVKVADPVFMGFAARRNASVACKVVTKTDPAEPVGLVVCDKSTNRPRVLEYSELPPGLAAKRETAEGPLVFRAANIVNHYYSLDFLAGVSNWDMNAYLPYHVAHKKIPTVDASGEPVAPEKPNGVKLERFVFDVFSQVPLEKFALLEVARKEEFSPLKNSDSAETDNPRTSRRDLLAQTTEWCRAAGAVVPEGAVVEVSPLTSYGGEGLEFLQGKELANEEIV